MNEHLLKEMMINCHENIQDVEERLEMGEDLLSDEELRDLHEEKAYHKGSLHALMTIFFNELGFSLTHDIEMAAEPIDVLDEFFIETYTSDRKFRYIYLN